MKDKQKTKQRKQERELKRDYVEFMKFYNEFDKPANLKKGTKISIDIRG